MESGAQEHKLKCLVVQPDGAPVAYPSASPAPSQESLAPVPVAAVASGSENVEHNKVNEKSVEKAIDKPSEKAPVEKPAAIEKPAVAESTVSAASTSASPAKPVSKPAGIAPALDPRDSRIASLQARNQELSKQVEDLQKLVAKSSSGGSGEQQAPPEWVALLNSQTGFPPVLVVLIALFSFLVGLLF